MTQETKPSSPVPVLRFAPSPTGALHVGSARAALFNSLYARKTSGKVFLRIEDTDQERSTPEAVETILSGFAWLGIAFDGEPLFQSARIDIYRASVQRLLETGHVYYCYCTPDELEQKRLLAQREKRAWKYDGACRDLTDTMRHAYEAEKRPKAVRFRVPDGTTMFRDLIRGEIIFENETIGDFIVLRADGTPIYQMAVVADDAEMGITLVMRGADHIPNTPRQIMLYEALGLPVPAFAHLPMILGPDKKKLSKRHGATSVTEYRDRGYLPEAVVNFLALLGWSPGDGREKMSEGELIEAFSIEGIIAKDAVFDEHKLEWLNGLYLKEKPAEEVFDQVVGIWETEGWMNGRRVAEEKDWLIRVIGFVKERSRRFPDFVELGHYFFRDPDTYDEKVVRTYWTGETAKRIFLLANRLEVLGVFDAVTTEEVVRQTALELGIAAAQLIHPIRLAVSGMSFGPGLFELLAFLGKEAVVRRLRLAVERIEPAVTS
ncbi:MAG: glutamate--tRNA ligase [Candidatus Latescibacteria bacterium]|nr:glutamate--tRNA ligase [Candidatus Latescibacterota bacterium]